MDGKKEEESFSEEYDDDGQFVDISGLDLEDDEVARDIAGLEEALAALQYKLNASSDARKASDLYDDDDMSSYLNPAILGLHFGGGASSSSAGHIRGVTEPEFSDDYKPAEGEVHVPSRWLREKLLLSVDSLESDALASEVISLHHDDFEADSGDDTWHPISSLEGIQHCKSLAAIHFDGNKVSDLSPLAACTQLEELWMFGNNVSDLSPLSSIRSLKLIQLGANKSVSDLSPLCGLPELDFLALEDNQVEDVSPISFCQKLEVLDLRQNRVSDISSLSSLTNLKMLNLSENSMLTDISSLKSLSKLEKLYLAETAVSDLSPIVDIATLKELSVEGSLMTTPGQAEVLAHLRSRGVAVYVHVVDDSLSHESFNMPL